MVRRPYPTYQDRTYPPTEAVWRALRELRAAPPGRATRGARKEVFNAALEQAEQLFTSAAGAGPASRPLLLFYGLSQAGRAINACASNVTHDSFPLTGHGIVIADNSMTRTDLGLVTVKDKLSSKGKDSFVQVATALGSRSLPESTRLADLWSTIEEAERWPLATPAKSLLHLDWHLPNHRPGNTTLQAIVSGMPGSLAEISDPQRREIEVRTWLSNYPALGNYTFLRPGAIPDTGPESRNEREGTIGCWLTWALEEHDDAAREQTHRITPWNGRHLANNSRVLHAQLGSDHRQLHPLLSWWAVLFAMSMLARYQPDRWTTYINVNTSKDAVAVEFLLDTALKAVPELILASIDETTD